MPDKPVDRWHVDTTPFVVVIFLTDPKSHEGGRFEVRPRTRVLKRVKRDETIYKRLKEALEVK